MDLGVLLESPQGGQCSSRGEACTCAFLPSCSSSVTLPFAWIKGSVSFPGGFPTRFSHRAFPGAPWCVSILGVKVVADQGKQVPLEWIETSGVSWNGARTLEFLSPFLLRAPPLEMGRERREFFPDHAGKGSLLSKRRKRGSSGCGRDSRASSHVEMGMWGNFLSCSKRVKYPLEVPEVRRD